MTANAGLPADGIAVTCDKRFLREVRICMTKDLGFRSCPEIDRRDCRLDKAVMPPVRETVSGIACGTMHASHSFPLFAIRYRYSLPDCTHRTPHASILYASASPYSAKVRMAAAYAGIAVDAVIVDTNARPPELFGNNPLGKMPVLLTDDGAAIFDSRAITQYLNRLSGGALFPRNAAKRPEAERLEALADGICDCLLAHVYERRFRPEEKVHQPWLDKQWEKVVARARPSRRGDAEAAARSSTPAISRCAPRSATSTCASPGNGNAATPS